MFVLYPTESTAAGLRLADPGFSGPPPGCLHTNKAASKSGREHGVKPAPKAKAKEEEDSSDDDDSDLPSDLESCDSGDDE